MNIVRTFHPVGQGAFYSERFYEDEHLEAKCNLVYDCGTSWGNVIKAKKVVTQAFDKKDVIDYLFISHLDYDHISLVLTLIDSVKCVREIVFPLVLKDDIVIAISLNRISNHGDAADFLQTVLNRVASDRKNENLTPLESEIMFVGSEDEKWPQNTQIWKNGESRTIGSVPDWLLIPYNVKSQERKNELIAEFDGILHDDKLLSRLSWYRLYLPPTGKELYELLKNLDFVKKVIATRELKNAIKSAYEKVTGGVNANSLILYSGPASMQAGYRMVTGYHRWRDYYDTKRVGCLYTGDSDCDLSGWKTQRYTTVWDNIGTIQLPHHGSLASFDIVDNPIDRRFVFPVSCGSTNSYGHPSGKVLAYLTTKDCTPKIVTENGSTVYMQRIIREK